jgi:hypothetical protein
MWAFDLIELDGADLRPDPLHARKDTLGTVLMRAAPGVRFNEHMEEEDGSVIFHHACKLGLEGIVSKRRESRYHSGRSRHWWAAFQGARNHSSDFCICGSIAILHWKPQKVLEWVYGAIRPKQTRSLGGARWLVQAGNANIYTVFGNNITFATAVFRVILAWPCSVTISSGS